MKFFAEIECASALNRSGKTVTREAVRGIIPAETRLLMVYSPVNGDYKFPGGGIGREETPEEALRREILEECGIAGARVESPCGQVIEYDRPEEPDFDIFKMTSTYYLCAVDQEPGLQSLDPYEADLGFQALWVEIDQAIRTNHAVLSSTQRQPPRWTRRDTFVLEKLRELDKF